MPSGAKKRKAMAARKQKQADEIPSPKSETVQLERDPEGEEAMADDAGTIIQQEENIQSQDDSVEQPCATEVVADVDLKEQIAEGQDGSSQDRETEIINQSEHVSDSVVGEQATSILDHQINPAQGETEQEIPVLKEDVTSVESEQHPAVEDLPASAVELSNAHHPDIHQDSQPASEIETLSPGAESNPVIEAEVPVLQVEVISGSVADSPAEPHAEATGPEPDVDSPAKPHAEETGPEPDVEVAVESCVEMTEPESEIHRSETSDVDGNSETIVERPDGDVLNGAIDEGTDLIVESQTMEVSSVSDTVVETEHVSGTEPLAGRELQDPADDEVIIQQEATSATEGESIAVIPESEPEISLMPKAEEEGSGRIHYSTEVTAESNPELVVETCDTKPETQNEEVKFSTEVTADDNPELVVETCDTKPEPEIEETQSSSEVAAENNPEPVEICDTELEPEVAEAQSSTEVTGDDDPEPVETCDTKPEPEIEEAQFSTGVIADNNSEPVVETCDTKPEPEIEETQCSTEVTTADNPELVVKTSDTEPEPEIEENQSSTEVTAANNPELVVETCDTAPEPEIEETQFSTEVNADNNPVPTVETCDTKPEPEIEKVSDCSVLTDVEAQEEESSLPETRSADDSQADMKPTETETVAEPELVASGPQELGESGLVEAEPELVESMSTLVSEIISEYEKETILETQTTAGEMQQIGPHAPEEDGNGLQHETKEEPELDQVLKSDDILEEATTNSISERSLGTVEVEPSPSQQNGPPTSGKDIEPSHCEIQTTALMEKEAEVGSPVIDISNNEITGKVEEQCTSDENSHIEQNMPSDVIVWLLENEDEVTPVTENISVKNSLERLGTGISENFEIAEAEKCIEPGTEGKMGEKQPDGTKNVTDDSYESTVGSECLPVIDIPTTQNAEEGKVASNYSSKWKQAAILPEESIEQICALDEKKEVIDDIALTDDPLPTSIIVQENDDTVNSGNDSARDVSSGSVDGSAEVLTQATVATEITQASHNGISQTISRAVVIPNNKDRTVEYSNNTKQSVEEQIITRRSDWLGCCGMLDLLLSKDR